MVNMPEVPVTLEDDKDWIKKISRKFRKDQIIEKLNTIGADHFDPKQNKQSLVEELLYCLREQIDDEDDVELDNKDNDDDDDNDNDDNVDDDDDDDDDEPYSVTDDPSYRSELDGDLEEEEQDNEELDEEDDDEDDDTFVARMRKKLGLTDAKSNYFVSSWTDPTLLFCSGTLLSVVFVRGDSATKTLSLVPTNEIPSQLFTLFVDPAFVAGFLFLAMAYYMTKDYVHDRFTSAQRREAGWYLWNGAIIHIMMDGMAGGGHIATKGGWGLKLMNDNYQILDKRFSRDATDGDIAVATTITQTELYVHSILTFFAYVGLCRRTKWADVVSSIALSFQLFGAIVFIVPDLLTGCPNMQPFDDKTCTPDATMFTLFYFWFGVMVNFVWVIVPAMMLKDIIQRQ